MIRFNDFESNNTKYHVTKQNGLISELGVVTLLFGVSIFWGFPPEKRALRFKLSYFPPCDWPENIFSSIESRKK